MPFHHREYRAHRARKGREIGLTIREITFPRAPNPRLSSTRVCWKGHRPGGAHAESRWNVPAYREIIHSSEPYWFDGRPDAGF